MVSKEREKVVDCGKAVMFLIVCGDEVLLQKRPNNKRGFANETIIPGGKSNKGEKSSFAAKREIMKETGLVGVTLVPLGDNFRVITTNAHLYSMQAYRVEIDDKSCIVNMESDSGKLVWVKFDEAKENQNWAHFKLVFDRAEKLLKEGS